MVTALMLALALAGDQGLLAAARDLYASAAYEEALSALDKATAAASPEDTRAIAQYRAFCLLALGRAGDAQHAIETVVAADPTFRPASNDSSPRVRAAFAEVRRRMLPEIIQQRYGAAKTSFDRKDFKAASAAFGDVLALIDDVDVAASAGQPPLSDLRMLASGFHDLAASAAAPAPLPAAAPPPVAAAAPPAPMAAPLRVYAADDRDVVPPQIIRQELPAFPGDVLVPKQGTIEVVIDAAGAVESAMIRRSVTPAYDSLALTAARGWRYRPATMNGQPVKFRKTIQISVKPRTR